MRIGAIHRTPISYQRGCLTSLPKGFGSWTTAGATPGCQGDTWPCRTAGGRRNSTPSFAPIHPTSQVSRRESKSRSFPRRSGMLSVSPVVSDCSTSGLIPSVSSRTTHSTGEPSRSLWNTFSARRTAPSPLPALAGAPTASSSPAPREGA